MPTIKERFKSGLQKTVNVAIGTPEQRQHQRDVDFKVKDARRRGVEQGRIKGAYQEGYKRGKQRSKQGSGLVGALGASVQGFERGLNAGASIIGVFPDPPQRSHKKHKSRHHRSNDDDIIF